MSTSPAPVFGTILVPLDGSATAEAALPVAATIARRSGAALHLVSVHVPVPTLLDITEEPVMDGALEEELREQQTAYLATTATAASTAHGVETTHAVRDLHGTVVKAIATEAHAKRADLIVMTTHGHGGINPLWLGSVADRLLRRTQTPVLLLRVNDGEPPTVFRHVLVALDGTAEGERALEPAVALGMLAHDVRFTLVQVVEPPIALITRLALTPAHMRPHWREQRENSARAYLERVAERLRGRGCRVNTEMVPARGVGEQILAVAGRLGADLIAVGTHAAHGMERLLLGSVADKVIRGASQAVLVIPTKAET